MYLYAGSARARGVGDCTCLLPTLNDLGETSGPRIDRIQPVRPPWWRRQYRELKKLIFSAPSTCPIDLFGPVANRTVLKRLHAPSTIGLVCIDTLGRFFLVAFWLQRSILQLRYVFGIGV